MKNRMGEGKVTIKLKEKVDRARKSQKTTSGHHDGT
jgi:hypothetical protein